MRPLSRPGNLSHRVHRYPRRSGHGTVKPLGFEQSKALLDGLKAAGHIDAKGRVQDSLKKALKDGSLQVPPAFAAQLDQISAVLKKLAGRLEIKNADDRRRIRTRQAVLHSAEFQALWDRIKHKTTYRVAFDNAKLIESCTRPSLRANGVSLLQRVNDWNESRLGRVARWFDASGRRSRLEARDPQPRASCLGGRRLAT